MSDILTAENWWEMIPGRNEGAAKLLKRSIELLAWRVDFAMNVLFAYKDFMECKAFLKDWDATRLEPSLPVYQMWNQHILDTKHYADDCKMLFGNVIHYNPNHYKEQQSRNERIARTMKLISERNSGSYIDPMVWNFGHPQYPHPGQPPHPGHHPHHPPPPPQDPHHANKRARVETGNSKKGSMPDSSVPPDPPLRPKVNAAEIFAVIPPAQTSKRAPTDYVTLRIYKTADGGAMDNKVTLKRDQELRTVLNYYRYRCLWRNGQRLNLHLTPNKLKMGAVENIVLATIHIDETITMWFQDWKGYSMPVQMRMGETFAEPFAMKAKSLGVDKSKLQFAVKTTVLSVSSTPMLSQLDHGDHIIVSLIGGEEAETGAKKNGNAETKGNEANSTSI